MLRSSSWIAAACLAAATVTGLCLSEAPAIGGDGEQPMTLRVAGPGGAGSEGLVGQLDAAPTPNQHQRQHAAAPFAPSKAAEKTGPGKPKYRTHVAKQAAAKLDVEVSMQLETGLDTLADELSEQIGVPVLVDVGAIEYAGLESSQTNVTFSSDNQPLRSSLRKILQPLGLRAEVQDEGLVITADFSELTRRGILTDKWVGMSDELVARVDAVLATEVVLAIDRTPLNRAIADFSNAVGFPMNISRISLEAIGLTEDVPVRGSPQRTTSDDPDAEKEEAESEASHKKSHVQKLPLGAALNFMLYDLDLVYTIGDGMILVMTREDAESRLLTRLYFLEGTGLPRGDQGSTMSMIQTTIEPGSWEALGGVGTMVSVGNGESARPSLLVSTTLGIHEQVADLMRSLRESHVGPDPIWSGRPPAPSGPPIQGGWGGGGGGGGGGMF